MTLAALFPFLDWLPRTTGRSLGRDALVGLTGAILALPQSIAYALIAGLPAEYGLYAAVVPVIVACLWGSSWHLIGGPTAAISVVLFASVSPLARPGSDDYIALVLLVTFLAGLFQWLLGVLRFGSLANFVSQSVVIGFTLGAALVIALGQIPSLLGLPSLEGRSTALQRALELAGHFHEVHGPSVLVALVTLAVAVLLRRLAPRLPALLLGLVAGSLLVAALPGSMADVPLVPPFSGSLPPFETLRFDLDGILRLLPAAVACGLLGLVTSLSIARALAAQSQQVLDVNRETRGQGLSNLVGAWFSGYLSAGSFTRSALNLQAGATSARAAFRGRRRRGAAHRGFDLLRRLRLRAAADPAQPGPAPGAGRPPRQLHRLRRGEPAARRGAPPGRRRTLPGAAPRPPPGGTGTAQAGRRAKQAGDRGLVACLASRSA